MAVTGSAPPRRATIARASLTASATSLAGIGVRFATQLVLARLLGAGGFGTFQVSKSWGELLSKFPNRGYNLTLVRHLPAYEAVEDWGRYRGLLRTSARATDLASAVLTAGALAVVLVWHRDQTAVVVALALVPLFARFVLFQAGLQAMHRYGTAIALGELVQPILLAVGVAVLAVTGVLGATAAVVMYVVSVAICLVAARARMAAATPAPVRTAPIELDRSGWLRTTRPAYLAQLSVTVLATVDLLAIGMFASDETAGVYAAASRIAVLGLVVATGVESVSAPHLSAAFGRNDTRGAQRVIDQAIALAALPTLVLFIGAVVLGSPVLGLLGPEFADGRTTLLILLGGYALSVACGPVGSVIGLSQETRTYGAVMGLHAVVGTAATVVAAAWGSPEAVALVTVAIRLSWTWSLAAVAHRRLDLRCWPRLRR